MISEKSTVSSNRFMYILWNFAILVMTPFFIYMGQFSETVAFFFAGILGVNGFTKVAQHKNEKKYHDDTIQ